MNERIKELAEQARQEFLKLTTGYQPEQVGMYPQLMEKFALLIIEECARELDERTVFVRGHRAGTWIKQHFGVEE